MSPANPAPGTPEAEPGATAARPQAGARSVSVRGDNHAPITMGDNSPISQVTIGSLRPVEDVPPAAGPVGITMDVPLFVGREPELVRLEQTLAAGPGAVVQAVHGLGGIGKSALAARYVALHGSRYTQVVWITAEDTAGIEAGLRRFALALEPQLDFLSSEVLVERATAWLAAHQGWLLVLDNVTSPKDISALLGRLRGGGGRFLATSRNSVGWSRVGATPVRLDVLEPDQALALLASTVGTTPGALDGGAELCAELGFLPLALTQAGAYIAQNQLGDEPSARKYLRLLANHPAHMYATGDEDTDSEGVIARTWNITLDRLADDPLAGRILRVLAWYAPDRIPSGILDPLSPQPGLDEALGKLAAYNMITLGPRDPAAPEAGRHVKVHRLVQAVTRTHDPTDPHRDPIPIAEARDQAATLLNRAAPDDPSDWRLWRRFIAHVQALAENTDPAVDGAETAFLLQRATFYLSEESTAAERGVGNAMYVYIGRTVSAYERILGPEDRKTLIARRWRAWFFEDLDTLQKVGADLERVLGADDPEFLVVAARPGMEASAPQGARDGGEALPPGAGWPEGASRRPVQRVFRDAVRARLLPVQPEALFRGRGDPVRLHAATYAGALPSASAHPHRQATARGDPRPPAPVRPSVGDAAGSTRRAAEPLPRATPRSTRRRPGRCWPPPSRRSRIGASWWRPIRPPTRPVSPASCPTSASCGWRRGGGTRCRPPPKRRSKSAAGWRRATRPPTNSASPLRCPTSQICYWQWVRGSRA